MDSPALVIDPHVQAAILYLGGALLAAFVLGVLLLADMTPINKDKDDKDDFPPSLA